MISLDIDHILIKRNIQYEITSANMELRTISDHASVNISWHLDKHLPRKLNWRLDNFLLDYSASRSQIEAEIKIYFSINLGTAPDLTVW